MPSSEPPDRQESAIGSAGRLPAAAGQIARDRSRLRTSEAAVTTQVIEFQLARQRIGQASAETTIPLSPRELEVVRLLTAGRTDGQIADELFISKKTASVHIANIKGKLGASTRVEIAMLAAHLGLAEASAAPDEIEQDRGRGARRAVVCPFKGLASFDVGDAAFFFGRERVVAELVARSVGSTFLAVVGPSGSGKSSVVRAGLIPALAEGVLPGSEHWAVTVLRPGETPTQELRHALTLALRPDVGLHGDATSFDVLLDALPSGVRILLVVDQFEETFTICEDEEERAAFVRALTDLAHDPGARALVVLAVRADFYGRCAEYRHLAELMGASHVLVGPMGSDELARAVELPARAAGLRVEPELTTALVTDVFDQPGGLPLLSTTLLDLWQRRDGRTLRHETYERIGGVSGAVARLAESAFAQLTPDQQSIARAVFLRLATRGDEDIVVRRPARIREFDADQNADVARVLAVLTDSRLLTVGEGSVEVAHEALLREWPRLRQWLDEDAENREVRQHLTHAAQEWELASGDPAELYRGARLSAALDWSGQHHPELNELERRFLDESGAASEREIERQRRINRRLRGFLAAAAVFLVVAVGAGGFAAIQRERAEQGTALAEQEAARAEQEAARADRGASVARSRELAASAVAALDRDPALSKLLALAAASVEDPPMESIAVLHEAWAADRTIYRYTWPDAKQGGGLWADLDPSGQLVVAAAGDGPDRHMQVVEWSTGQVLWTYPGDGDPPVSIEEPVFSEDGKQVITGVLWDREGIEPPKDTLGVRIWDARTGELEHRIDLGPCGGFVTGVSASRLLVRMGVCPGAEGEESLWVVDLHSDERTRLSKSAESETISGDGRYVAFDDGPGRSVVLDLKTGKPVLEIDPRTTGEYKNGIRRLNHDGSLLLYGDTPIQVWDVKRGKLIAKFTGHAGDSYWQEWLGDTVYSTGRDESLRAWDARTGKELSVVRAIWSGRPSLSSDGGMVLVADQNAPRAVLVDLRVRGEVGSAATCPGDLTYAGSLHVAGGVAAFNENCTTDLKILGVTNVIDVASGKPLYPPLVGVASQTLDFSPDGARFVRQDGPDGLFGQIAIRAVRTGNEVLELEGVCISSWNEGPREEYGACRPFPNTPFPIFARSLRWSPDGSMIAAVDGGNGEEYMAVWDARDGKLIFRGPTDQPASDVIFSPDSKALLVSYQSGIFRSYSTQTWQVVRSSGVAQSGQVRVGIGFVAFTPDGSTLVGIGGLGGTGGGALHWLDAATLEPRRPSVNDAFDGSPKSAAMSPDGSLIATGASDGLVRVWDTQTGHLVHEIPIGDTEAQGVAFLDDKHLAVTPRDGSLYVYTLDPAELLRIVRSSLTRGFTKTECERFNFGDACPTLEQLRGG
jgi:WD40 repeat protein/DNA-binding CsgD family transcriptional regulator